mmetsp:Transcript_16072/g.20002  ORF Transcript_16072/g.20002 Transcript_16072/m.20002 type:complete len:405 (-) Transcript_16072:235-1449(-)
MTKATPDTTQPLELILEPHPNDVLCGRGNHANNHIGNEYFRSLIKQNESEYARAPKKAKKLYARKIVDNIRQRNPPGRFLKQDAENNGWYDIGDKQSLNKTRQALRENVPKIMQQERVLETVGPTGKTEEGTKKVDVEIVETKPGVEEENNITEADGMSLLACLGSSARSIKTLEQDIQDRDTRMSTGTVPLTVDEAKELTNLLNNESLGTYTAASSMMMTSLTPNVSSMSFGITSQDRRKFDGFPNGFTPMDKGFSFRSLACADDSDDEYDDDDDDDDISLDEALRDIRSVNSFPSTNLKPMTSITLDEMASINKMPPVTSIALDEENEALNTIIDMAGITMMPGAGQDSNTTMFSNLSKDFEHLTTAEKSKISRLSDLVTIATNDLVAACLEGASSGSEDEK